MKKFNKKLLFFVILILIILICTFIYIFSNQPSQKNSKNTNNNLTTTNTTITMSNSDLAYSTNRADFASDEQFANFRQLSGGNINLKIYRGSSPIDNTHNRANITDRLLKENKINYIINLTNSEEAFKNMQNISTNSPYTFSLYNDNKIYFGNLSTNYSSKDYATKMATSLIQITKNDGPFYIHCTHGRDRTGMACIILEALADASFSEILDDYMKTFDNYNSVNRLSNPSMYDKILNSRFKTAIKNITREESIEDYTTYNYKKAAENYLKFGGLTDSQITELIDSITK